MARIMAAGGRIRSGIEMVRRAAWESCTDSQNLYHRIGQQQLLLDEAVESLHVMAETAATPRTGNGAIEAQAALKRAEDSVRNIAAYVELLDDMACQTQVLAISGGGRYDTAKSTPEDLRTLTARSVSALRKIQQLLAAALSQLTTASSCLYRRDGSVETDRPGVGDAKQPPAASLKGLLNRLRSLGRQHLALAEETAISARMTLGQTTPLRADWRALTGTADDTVSSPSSLPMMLYDAKPEEPAARADHGAVPEDRTPEYAGAAEHAATSRPRITDPLTEGWQEF